MLQLALGAVVITGVVLTLLDNETKNQHERFQRKERQLRRETAQQHAKIQAALKLNAEYQEFKQYIEMHYASVQTSRQAFELYQSAKDVLNSLYLQLKISGEKIQKLKMQRENQHGLEFQTTKQLLQQQYEIHKQIKVSIDAYKQQKDQYLTEVRSLNEATAQLKQHIRYHTGQAGLEWYKRLELRRV